MPEYGVTEQGFVLKRLDVILDEVHKDLSDGFGIDTRLREPSFLNSLVTSFCGQIATLWETAQESYYAKYPATAEGVNLDNAVQYGGIRRAPSRKTVFPLHCTGNDGTIVRSGTTVASNTNPPINLKAQETFYIKRDAFNKATVKLTSALVGSEYSVTINGAIYSYTSVSADPAAILAGIQAAITDTGFAVTVITGNEPLLSIEAGDTQGLYTLELSANLTTDKVTTIANFETEDYGKYTIPNGVITVFVDNVPGFTSVTNLLDPTYGRDTETDIELRQSYMAKSQIRSNTMIGSIMGEILNNIPGVEKVVGYENDTNTTSAEGMPPHSIELVVEGGSDYSIAESILKRKAGGISTYGTVTVNVRGDYNDSVPVHFSRPEYEYVWFKVVVHGDALRIPPDYQALIASSIVSDCSGLGVGDSLLIQTLTDEIYNSVAGVQYLDIYTAVNDGTEAPDPEEYTQSNVLATKRQRIKTDASKIGVSMYGG